MNLRSVLLAATVLALPAAAVAQPVNGPYVGAGVGYNYTQNINVHSVTGVGVAVDPSLSGNGGVAGLGSVGWGFGNGLRAEIEGNYRNNSYRVTQNGVNLTNRINANNYGVMVNGLYDFNLGPVNPYVGAGVGYNWTQLGGNAGMSSVTGGAVAAQAILGAAIPVGVPGLAVTAEYRFLATVENTTFTQNGTKLTVGNIYNHAVLLGIRYAFNTAPPPPPPMPAPVAAPAPAPARSYLVFFDWDKADLSARARQIIAEAAQNSTRVQLTQIEVNGYADRTGTAQYNLGLSRRRADNVAAELVKDGVPKNVIAIMAYGDTHLLVPTAPGVREPQNRRVEIILK